MLNGKRANDSRNNMNIQSNSAALGKKMNKFKKNFSLLILALPGLATLILFRYSPMFGLILPFKNYQYDKGLFGSDWCGFDNFKYLVSSNDVFRATINTTLYNFGFIITGIVLGIFIALLLNELSSRFVKIYHTVLYIPHFVSWVVAAYIINVLLNVDNGIFNHILETFGREPIQWYSESKYWPLIIFVSNIWKTIGSSAVMYYAALVGISPEYYEAAKMDGASKLQCIFRISIPMIKNVIIVLFIMNVGKIMFADFGLFYNVPMNSPLLYSTTDVLDTYVYRSLMNLGDIGMSSAAAFYQSVIGFILVMATNMICKKLDPDSGLF